MMLIDTERVVVGVVGLVVIWISHLIWRWMNPKCGNGGILPPGSMGFPLIGETLSLIRPSYSLDLHPFLRKRIQRYGEIFKTSIAGHPVVVSADAEVNAYLLQQEGRLVELWYLDTFSKVFALEGDSRISAIGGVHRYMRTIFLTHFGGQALRNLIPHIQLAVDNALTSWSTRDSVEVKTASSALTLDFSAKHAINYDHEKSTINLAESYHKFSNLFMSFPLNIPGTAFSQGLKVQKSLDAVFRKMLKERINSPELQRKDFLGQVAKDINSEEYLTEDFMVNLIFIGLFGTFETISTTVALAFKLLSDHPRVVEEMIAEHESILEKRADRSSPLTWEECKSMTFTLQVINETLRLTSHTPGLMRKTRQDIPTKKGFTIPKGWAIMLLTSSLHFNSNTYKNPLEFNPWRWKELDSLVVSKNFMPFGGGNRQCAGSEYSRIFMAILFHVLFTKYSWEKVKMGKIARNPIMQFGDGIHIKFSKKQSKYV